MALCLVRLALLVTDHHKFVDPPLFLSVSFANKVFKEFAKAMVPNQIPILEDMVADWALVLSINDL